MLNESAYLAMIRSLIDLESSAPRLDFVTGSTAELQPFLANGDWVCIDDGPLKGLTGMVTECKKGLRVVVSVSLLQRSVAVEVSRLHIRPTTSPSARMAPLAMAARHAGR